MKKPVAEPSSSTSIPAPAPEEADPPSLSVTSLSFTNKLAVSTVVVVPSTSKSPAMVILPLAAIVIAFDVVAEPIVAPSATVMPAL